VAAALPFARGVAGVSADVQQTLGLDDQQERRAAGSALLL
jgi:hypothetical protein